MFHKRVGVHVHTYFTTDTYGVHSDILPELVRDWIGQLWLRTPHDHDGHGAKLRERL